MVDSIGPPGSTPTERLVAPVTATPAVSKAISVTSETPSKPSEGASTAGRLASEMAASPPVDVDRVMRIRKAIADGHFPILPTTIADQMLALRLNWVPYDKA